jgi:diguanylate cyclase (GGDEF)-like protein
MDTEIELLKAMVSALPDPVFVITESGYYAVIAGGQDSDYYHDGSHLAGLALHDVLEAEKADWFLEQVRQTLLEGGMRTVEYRLAGEEVDGIDVEAGPAGTIYFEGHIQPLHERWKGERAVVWLARNINRRHALEIRLRHMSETDALTGAYNRRKLMEELESRFAEFRRYGQPCALIMFDLDRFKDVNDQFGHGVGDEVLCRITDIARRQLREPDVFCRIGGEEFALLAPGTDLEAARQLGERLREAIANHDPDGEHPGQTVTVSAGISAFMRGDKHMEDVMIRADNGLYEAKRAGRNQVLLVQRA